MSVTISRLDNGLAVVTEAMPHLQTASVGVWVNGGARHESAAQTGVAHLLEHMAFKGTERRDARAIAEEIEAVGGHLNAHTGREHTAYYARVLRENVPLAIDLLADILQNSVFSDEELVRERDVVIQEIAQANDTPDDIVFDHLQAVAYPDQALGRSILGTAAQVGSYGADDLRGYMADHYGASRMVVAAAGAIDHDAVVRLVETAFAGRAGGTPTRAAEACWRGGETRDERDLEQAHLAVGFDAVSYHDEGFYPLQLFATALGGGMSSRLFQEVREKRGLAYSVFSYATAYHDGGMFGVYAGTAPEHLAELGPLIVEQMVEAAEAIAPAEVDRARAQLKAGLLMSLESSAARIEQIGRQMHIFGRPLDVAEVVARIDAVDTDAVRRVAQKLIADAKPAVAAVGPIGGLETHDRFAARFG